MVVEVKVDYRRCTDCSKCVEICAFGVLEWFEEQPIVRNPSSCSVCLECKSCCPADAISVKQR